jgi:hypothetical protein
MNSPPATAPAAGPPIRPRSEHLIESLSELGIPVAKQKPRPQLAVGDPPHELPCLLGHPGGRGVGRAASQVNTATAELDEEPHIQALEPYRVAG